MGARARARVCVVEEGCAAVITVACASELLDLAIAYQDQTAAPSAAWCVLDGLRDEFVMESKPLQPLGLIRRRPISTH